MKLAVANKTIEKSGSRPWVLVAAAGRAGHSPRGMCKLVLSSSFLPWRWIDDSTDIFEAKVHARFGLTGASGWIESEVGAGHARLSLLARAWDARAFAAHDLLVQSCESALRAMQRGEREMNWIDLPGLGWGDMLAGQVESSSAAMYAQSALEDRRALVESLGSGARATAKSL
jgi:hypothetical protein